MEESIEPSIIGFHDLDKNWMVNFVPQESSQ